MSGPDPLAALAEALKALRPSAPTEALKPPTFDWQTTEQYEDFPSLLQISGKLVLPPRNEGRAQ